MKKEARKPSTDPVQERLRQNKAAWNKEVSSFINDLIHAKKLMNGWPNKYFKERAKIIFPIPGDPTTVLNNLAQKFQDLSQSGSQLVQEQLNYSKNRRLRRPEQASQTLNKLEEKYGPTETTVPPPVGGTQAPPAATDLTKQLSAHLDQKYQLTAEGSNPFSRFLSRMRTPQVGFGDAAQIRRLRMDMLKAALKSYRGLGKLQVEITKSSKVSIQEAHKMMQMAWNQWAVVSKNFNNYVNSLPDRTAPPRPEDMKEEGYSPEKEEAELTKPWEKLDTIKKIVSDYKNYGYLLVNEDSSGYVRELHNAINNILTTPKQQRLNVELDLEQFYEKSIRYLNENLGTAGATFKEIVQQLSKKRKQPIPPPAQPPATVYPPLQGSTPPEEPTEKEAGTQPQLEVVAQAFLRKWLGKTRHQIIPGKSSGIRLQVFELAKKARSNINHIMDLLEKGLYTDDMDPKISEISYQMNTLRSLMRSLAFTEKMPKGTEPGGFF